MQLECHNREPDYIPNRPGDDKAMIDPLRLPFEPISIPTSPSPPTPEQPGEETQPSNDHPNVPVDNASTA